MMAHAHQSRLTLKLFYFDLRSFLSSLWWFCMPPPQYNGGVWILICGAQTSEKSSMNNFNSKTSFHKKCLCYSGQSTTVFTGATLTWGYSFSMKTGGWWIFQIQKFLSLKQNSSHFHCIHMEAKIIDGYLKTPKVTSWIPSGFGYI